MRILFDKNVPIGVRGFLPEHEVRTFADMNWPDQLENGELLNTAEAEGFDALVTSDQNIQYQQNLKGRSLALIVLGSNIWPIVRRHEATIAARVNAARHGAYAFIEMPLTPKPHKNPHG